LAKCAYSQSYTDCEPYSDINSHSDGDTERYADCHTNIYTAATLDSKTSPDATASLTPARVARTPFHQKFSPRKFLMVCDRDW